jgi:hypothetical protein
MPVSLESLDSFGDLAAEDDFQPEFFVQSSAWHRIRGGKKPIAIGRKGSGKTSLRLALLEEAQHKPLLFAADLTFRDYPWRTHNSVFDSSVGKRARYVETWLFLILVELAKLAVGEDQAQPLNADTQPYVAAIRQFVRENWGHLSFEHHDIFRKRRYKVTKTLDPSALGVKIGSIEWADVDMGQLGGELRNVNKWLKSMLERVIRDDAEYWIVFDELDPEFQPGDEEYEASLTGLLLAVRDFRAWSKASLAGRGMAMALLRDDIYDELHFQDKNKISDSLVEELRWSEGISATDSMKPVIDERIRFFLGTSIDDPFALVFGDNETQMHVRIYRYMAGLTYTRPRDLIKYCNLALRQAQHNRKITRSITGGDVIGARRPFSSYLHKELDDEIRVHHSDWQAWLEVIRAIGAEAVSRRAFDHHCRESMKGRSSDITKIVPAMYQFGIVGLGHVRTNQTVYALWRHKNPDVPFDTRAQYLIVHPGLCDQLGIKAGSTSGVKNDRSRRSLYEQIRRDDLTRPPGP